ncbi:MAG: tRNA (adenosine(37)-N6)-threonylcarbamoyltransferase complex ATPase subunit type 1 TsaE [Clostridiales bacterium]|nr:tRNA (adenosine(37)-N6)-threonylcarbamoyltransferase complex ATPase subunit type 1 TsaE [Clostridiales bacterium]
MKKQIIDEISESVEDTEELGAQIGRISLEFNVHFAALYGDLGAGKTALTRGLVGVIAPGASVCSPTYSIVNEYIPIKYPQTPGKFRHNTETMPVFHFDMYRVEDEDALDSIGFYDYQERGGYIITEWSENIEYALPDNYFEVILTKLSDNKRRIVVNLMEL